MHIVNVFELKNKLLYFLPIVLDFSPEFSILIDSVVLIVSRHNWFPAKIRWMLENHQNHHIIMMIFIKILKIIILSWWSSSKSSYYDDDLIIRLLHLNGATASLVWQPNLPHPVTEQCTPKYFVHTCQKYLECNQKYLYNTFRKRFKFTRKYFYHTFQKHSNAIRNIFMTIFKNIWNALRNICSQIFEIFSFGLPQARWPIVFVHAPHKTFKQGVNFQQTATFYKYNAKWGVKFQLLTFYCGKLPPSIDIMANLWREIKKKTLSQPGG